MPRTPSENNLRAFADVPAASAAVRIALSESAVVGAPSADGWVQSHEVKNWRRSGRFGSRWRQLCVGFVLYGSDGQPRAAFCYPDRTKAERAAKGFAAMLANCERIC